MTNRKLFIGLLLFLLLAPFWQPALGQMSTTENDFLLCSSVNVGQKDLTLGWTPPGQEVSGYALHYNGYPLHTYRPTVEDPYTYIYNSRLSYGRHRFQIYGYNSDLGTNEIEVELQKPRYHLMLLPGLYQFVHSPGKLSSCMGDGNGQSRGLQIVPAAALISATGFSLFKWGQFFVHRRTALDERQRYLDTLEGQALANWRNKRDLAKSDFRTASIATVVTLTANLATAIFLTPRGRARIKGGFKVDCNTHPDRATLCVKF